jgi:hypothetical protein
MNDLLVTVDEAFDYHLATLTQLKGVSHTRHAKASKAVVSFARVGPFEAEVSNLVL